MPISAETLQRIRDNDPTLTSLNLSFNEIRATGAQALAAALKTNTALTSLNLVFNQIGAEGVQALADVIQTNTTLTGLNLGGNRIEDAGARALETVLQNNRTLTTLDLSHNQIGAAGAHVLADLLQSNTALTSLSLYDNRIKDAGATALAAALQNNTTLTNINLCRNQIGAAGAQSLATVERLIERNKKLPRQISDKIYQSFVQRNQAMSQEGRVDSNSVVLTEAESSFIDTSPRSCSKILDLFLSRDDIRGTDPDLLFNHIKEFPGGLRMMVSSMHSQEVVNGLGLEKRKLDLKDLFALKGVAKDLSKSESKIGALPEDLSKEILSYLQIDDIKRPNPRLVNQAQESSESLSSESASAVSATRLDGGLSEQFTRK